MAPRSSEPSAQQLLNAAQRSHQQNRLPEAERLYRQVLKRTPRNLTALVQLGVILLQSGRAEDAIPLLRKARSLAPKSAEVQANLGLSYLALGDAAKAVSWLSKAVKQLPQIAELQAHLANALVAQEKYAEARRCLEAAIRMVPSDAGLHVNLGNITQTLGDSDVAAAHYRDAIAIAPTLAAAHNGLALIRQQQGRFEEAITAYRAALESNPADPTTLNNLGTLLRELGRFDEAARYLMRSAEIAPRAGTYANLATLLERGHRHAEAEQAAQQALALDPGHGEARLVRAKLHDRQGDKAAAKAAYTALVDSLEETDPSHLKTLARAKGALATLCEQDGDFRQAMRLFTEANVLNRRTNPAWEQATAHYLEQVRGVRDLLEGLSTPAPPAVPASSEPAPVFLVGFPRSGTTLLDQVLDAHSGVAVLEEKTLIDQLRDESGLPPARWSGLISDPDPEWRRTLRAGYWQKAGTHLDLRGRLLIDKLPLNLINLWLIWVIFPNAKIVVCLRDPRDVCLSCFTNLFSMQSGLASFPTLADTARLYAEVMGVWLRSSEVLPLQSTSVRYEDLVADLESEARKLLAFLDLPWEAAVLNYRDSALRRLIVTPSYHQVVRPLYGSSTGRWRHYPEEISEIQPILASFVDAFGYEPA